jgi:chromosome segregation ATPase
MRFVPGMTAAAGVLAMAGLLAAAPAPLPPAAKPVGAPAAPAAPALTENERSHVAMGEGHLDQDWLPLDRLFEEYQAVLAQVDDTTGQIKGRQASREDILKRAAVLKAKCQTREMPVQDELGKAKTRQEKLKNDLAALKEPVSPDVARVATAVRPDGTTAPDRKLQEVGAKDAEVRDWQHQSAQAMAKYRAALAQYNTDLQKYHKAQEAVRTELTAVDAQILTLEGAVAKIRAEVAPDLPALLEQVSTFDAEMADLNELAQKIRFRLDTVAAAIHMVGEPLRLKSDIVEWDGRIMRLADLQKVAAGMQADMAKARQKAQADAVAAGSQLPADWRPPRQDDFDILAKLIARAKAAQAAK